MTVTQMLVIAGAFIVGHVAAPRLTLAVAAFVAAGSRASLLASASSLTR